MLFRITFLVSLFFYLSLAFSQKIIVDKDKITNQNIKENPSIGIENNTEENNIKALPSYDNVRGLYFRRGHIRKGVRLTIKLKPYGINAIVIDIKDVDGKLSFVPSNGEALKYKSYDTASISYREFKSLLDILSKSHIYTIARISLFKDCYISRRYNRLSLPPKKGYKSSYCWLNPANKEVWSYLLSLTKEALNLGFNEVQYDYVRFPAGKEASKVLLPRNIRKIGKTKILANFLKEAKRIINQKAKLSIDTFGVVAWSRRSDIRITGQDLRVLAKYIDVISPMLYPSHFSRGFDGYKNPGDVPYDFVYKGCIYTKRKVGKQVIVRPWIQGFSYRTSWFSPRYIKEQVRAVKKCGEKGFLIWNARARYRVVLHYLKGNNDKEG